MIELQSSSGLRCSTRSSERHPRAVRPLIPADECDGVEEQKPTECVVCGETLSGSDLDPRRLQVIDLPVVKPVVIEHQVHTLARMVGSQLHSACSNLPDDRHQFCAADLLREFDALSDCGGASLKVQADVAATIAGRHVFYNNSAYDFDSDPLTAPFGTGSTAADANDDFAIATDKSALLPGGADWVTIIWTNNAIQKRGYRLLCYRQPTRCFVEVRTCDRLHICLRVRACSAGHF